MAGQRQSRCNLCKMHCCHISDQKGSSNFKNVAILILLHAFSSGVKRFSVPTVEILIIIIIETFITISDIFLALVRSIIIVTVSPMQNFIFLDLFVVLRMFLL